LHKCYFEIKVNSELNDYKTVKIHIYILPIYDIFIFADVSNDKFIQISILNH